MEFKQIKYPGGLFELCDDPHNERVRIDSINGSLDGIDRAIAEYIPAHCQKIIVKAKNEEFIHFLSQGYRHEGSIPGYFKGESMHFLCSYLNEDRSRDKNYLVEKERIDKIISGPHSQYNTKYSFEIREIEGDEFETLAQFYASIFAVYPTPVHEPAHLRNCHAAGTRYLAVYEGDRLVSAASAEINSRFRNAELTDCATRPEYQGKGLIYLLLNALEQLLLEQGISCHYTLARSGSFGMNKAFYNLGFSYSGKLINNCHIYSGIENMNVWYKNH